VADAAREAALGLREARHVLALLLGSGPTKTWPI